MDRTSATAGQQSPLSGGAAPSDDLDAHDKILGDMQEQFQLLERSFHTLRGQCLSEIRTIQEEKKRLRRQEIINRVKLEELQRSAAKTVRLNVGGEIFEAGECVLRKYKGSLLDVMLSGDFGLERTEEGDVFVDRDPKLFRHIIQFLRTGQVPQLEQDSPELRILLQEAKFYGLDPLAWELENNREEWICVSSQRGCVEGDIPSARCFALVQCVASNVLYVFGGCTAHDEFFNSLHRIEISPIFEEDSSNFLTPSSSANLTPRYAPSDDDVSEYGIFGLPSKHRFRFVPIHATYGDPPNPRSGHAMVFFDNHLILMYGNDDIAMLEDIHFFNVHGGGWTKATIGGDVVEPRSGFSATVVGSNVYIIGGKRIFPTNRCHGDLFKGTLDTTNVTVEWQNVALTGDLFPRRAYHTTVEHQGYLYVHGGIVNDVYSKDLCRIHLETGVNRVINATNTPGYNDTVPRSGHVALVSGDFMYTCGSYSEDGCDMQLFKFSFATHKWSRVRAKGKLPSKRAAPAATLFRELTSASGPETLFLFGGFDMTTRKCYNDVFTIAL